MKLYSIIRSEIIKIITETPSNRIILGDDNSIKFLSSYFLFSELLERRVFMISDIAKYESNLQYPLNCIIFIYPFEKNIPDLIRILHNNYFFSYQIYLLFTPTKNVLTALLKVCSLKDGSNYINSFKILPYSLCSYSTQIFHSLTFSEDTFGLQLSHFLLSISRFHQFHVVRSKFDESFNFVKQIFENILELKNLSGSYFSTGKNGVEKKNVVVCYHRNDDILGCLMLPNNYHSFLTHFKLLQANNTIIFNDGTKRMLSQQEDPFFFKYRLSDINEVAESLSRNAKYLKTLEITPDSTEQHAQNLQELNSFKKSVETHTLILQELLPKIEDIWDMILLQEKTKCCEITFKEFISALLPLLSEKNYELYDKELICIVASSCICLNISDNELNVDLRPLLKMETFARVTELITFAKTQAAIIQKKNVFFNPKNNILLIEQIAEAFSESKLNVDDFPHVVSENRNLASCSMSIIVDGCVSPFEASVLEKVQKKSMNKRVFLFSRDVVPFGGLI
eukprot:TRINITY_DN1542_c0_g1_i1.p1 TRINITY_DN1542_c0_g1~~TRINITY_DN1542_c0_g1_i1.p1  ORF type:complete len:510 (+),score=131.03 TRINITY_DN1542_c0_g1_i1:32-1561(+)